MDFTDRIVIFLIHSTRSVFPSHHFHVSGHYSAVRSDDALSICDLVLDHEVIEEKIHPFHDLCALAMPFMALAMLSLFDGVFALENDVSALEESVVVLARVLLRVLPFMVHLMRPFVVLLRRWHWW